MIIGIPRERKAGERRVAITPDGVSLLSADKHQVVIETNAGKLSGYTDEEFSNSGAKIVKTLKEVWKLAELLVKVKEPAPEEIPFFRSGLAVFSFLHLAVAPDLTQEMIASGITSLDYDLVQLDNGKLPILEPMSVIAGKLSIQCGAYALQSSNGGRGILLGGTSGVAPAKVVVVGAGAAGSSATRVALGMGAEVTVLDISSEKLAQFESGHLKARTLFSTPSALRRELLDADLVIGSVLIPGALAPKLLTRTMLSTMKQGSVIVDICIDQGGFAESSHPTTIAEPTYTDSGIVHFCVPNMPALVPRTSTEALTNVTLSWILKLANNGISQALKTYPPLKRCLTSYQGNLTNKTIGQALNLRAINSEEVGF